MQKILIVEDDIDIQDILKNHLIDAEKDFVEQGVKGDIIFDMARDKVTIARLRSLEDLINYSLSVAGREGFVCRETIDE